MNSNQNVDFIELLNGAVKARVAEKVNEVVEQAKKELERRIAHEADFIALEVLKIYDIQHYQDRIVITVRKEVPR